MMYRKIIVLIVILMIGGLWSCEVSETDQISDVEDTIMRIIAADDSTYAIDGFENISNESFPLNKTSEATAIELMAMTEVVIDSNYIWRFGRSDMSNTQEVTIEIENDTAAVSLISHHITGVYHVQQFNRIWTSDSTWIVGDSVRFSQKPIEMTIDRRVAFRKRVLLDESERWMATDMTLAYGSSGEALNIHSLEWVAEDSTKILDDFETTFYGRANPLVFAMQGFNHINVIVSNDVIGNAESIVGKFGFHPRLNGPGLRNRVFYQYIETLESGDKVYSSLIPAVQRPLRHFKGFVEVLDFRTLFDHDYETYSAATVGFIYMMRQHVRPH